MTRTLLTILALGILLLIVVAISGRRVEAPVVPVNSTSTVATTTGGVGTLPSDPSGITVHDTYRDGVHTYAFDLYLPTPCHILSEPDVLVRESYPEQIAIAYTVVPPKSGTMCAQVISRVPVSAIATASAEARLSSITLNNVSIAFVLSTDTNQ